MIFLFINSSQTKKYSCVTREIENVIVKKCVKFLLIFNSFMFHFGIMINNTVLFH